MVRGLLVRLLQGEASVEVVGTASNGRDALAAQARLRPDVIVLDIEMPVMDGLAALPELVKADPAVQVVVASTLTTRGADVTLRALRLGAADYVPKPTAIGAIASGDGFRKDLVEKIKALGAAAQRRREPSRIDHAAEPRPAARPVVAAAQPPAVVAIGASTGGPQALFRLMRDLGPGFPLPILITQHMPAAFIPILADHITRLGGVPCHEARDGELIEAGRAYLAPGDRHLLVAGESGAPRATLSSAPPENFCRPAVDPMFRSAAAVFGGRTLAVVLTGMGHDGLAGARQIVGQGGVVLAQDESTSVVWGMPGAIVQADLASAVLPIDRLAHRIATLSGANRVPS
ncbi:MAG: chemotaxis response regulator protein-glutamate methylesterase [Acetobacteraceae bacterium]